MGTAPFSVAYTQFLSSTAKAPPVTLPQLRRQGRTVSTDMGSDPARSAWSSAVLSLSGTSGTRPFLNPSFCMCKMGFQKVTPAPHPTPGLQGRAYLDRPRCRGRPVFGTWYPTAWVRDPDDSPSAGFLSVPTTQGPHGDRPGAPVGCGRVSLCSGGRAALGPARQLVLSDWGLQVVKAIRSNLLSPGRPAAPKLLSMSLSTRGLTSFVLFICSPLGGLSGARSLLRGPTTGCHTPVCL